MAEIKVVVLDAGHGGDSGSDRGFLGTEFGMNEGQNNFLSLAVTKAYLEKNFKDIEVRLTREDMNDYPSLDSRGDRWPSVALFYSRHSNAYNGTVRGTEVYCHIEYAPAKAMAEDVCVQMSKLFGHDNRGAKDGTTDANTKGYKVVDDAWKSGTPMAMLVEIGFHDNKLDAVFMVKNREKIAQTEAEIIAKHLKLERKWDEADLKPLKGTVEVVSASGKLICRAFPNYNAPTVSIYKTGEVYNVVGELGDFYRLDNGNFVTRNESYVKFVLYVPPVVVEPVKVDFGTAKSELSFDVKPLEGNVEIIYRGASGVNYRREPDYKATVLGTYKLGEKFKVVGEIGDFYKLDNGMFLTKKYSLVKFTPSYVVQVLVDSLNIRQGAGTNTKITGTIKDKGKYTIVEEVLTGTSKWGKLKSGAGYISLGAKYVKKV